MAKLYFKYGTMNASKSADLLMTAHKYEQQGKNIICLRSVIDSRSKYGFIESRALAYKHKCISFNKNDNLYDEINDKIINKTTNEKINAILIDEAQFLTKRQVIDLCDIVDKLKIPVICYGLKNSYITGVLFEGSSALLYFADSIQEIKSVCNFCDAKATMNLRIKNGEPILQTDKNNAIVIGDIDTKSDYFITTCRKHYFNPKI